MKVTNEHHEAMYDVPEPAFTGYSFVILTYVHDLSIHECVNVGVLMLDERGVASFKVRSSMGRLSSLYGNELQRADLIPALRSLKNAFDLAVARKTPLLEEAFTLDRLASTIMPFKESSLQWGEPQSGITPNIALQADHLYERFVSRYDDKSTDRKTDEAVWAVLREKLVARNIERYLTRKKISSDIDEVQFDHAWKNGVWHVYEALSFELATPEGIQGKAARWSGHMLGLEGAREQIKPHFIVAPPKNDALMSSYQKAVALLKASPLSPEVFYEENADDLADLIMREMRDHDPSMLVM